MHAVYRPWFGRFLTVAIGVMTAGAAIVITWRDGVDELWRVGPWLALIAGTCWATFWRPRVEVSDGGVRLVNVLRTVDVPWPAIQLIDTKWALTLVTAYGTFTAWAAPAPGARAAVRAGRREAAHLPRSTYAGEGIRPGDLPSSASGEAAALIRRHWEGLRDAGHLADPRLEHERVPARWHASTIALGLVLGLLGIISAIT